nr:hypothetical protein Iba_scaffold48817CG0010 [Ipomoea batatas]
MDLLKIRHLAAEKGSNSVIPLSDVSGSSRHLDEMSLEPLGQCSLLCFCSKFPLENTPKGVRITTTLSAFGVLSYNKYDTHLLNCTPFPSEHFNSTWYPALRAHIA